MATLNAVNTALSGATGTGSFVGSTSPTLITPTLGVASATTIIPGYATTATSGATTTLTVSSAYQQYFTGTSTQTVQMPVTSTLVTGQSWLITNNSTGNVTIQSSGSNTITTIALATQCLVTCISTSGTTAASWSFNIMPVIDAWVSYTPTFTGFGTATTIVIYSRRVGSNLEIMGRFTTGTCTAVQAQMTLGYQGTNSNVTSSNSVITTLFTAGTVAQTVAAASQVVVNVAPNVGYINFGIQNSGNSGFAQANATACFNNASLCSILCTVPIAGW